MIPSEFGQKRKFRLSALTVSKSAFSAVRALCPKGRRECPLATNSNWCSRPLWDACSF